MLRLPDKKYFKLTKYAYYFQKLTLFWVTLKYHDLHLYDTKCFNKSSSSTYVQNIWELYK